MRKWTKDQLAAIESRNFNLLVSAAAGSGKTALLIERIKRLVLNEGVDVREILVMTFTRAAASEMKERLRQALTDALLVPEADIERIANQLYRLNRAGISTLDAFCAAFLRENFQAAGIDPDFKLGNEAELKMLKREAIEEVLESAYENDGDVFSQMAEMYSDNRSEEPLIQLILQFHAFLQTLPDPEEWCADALSHFDFSDSDFFRSYWGEGIRSYALEQVEIAENILEDSMELTDGHPVFEKTGTILKKDWEQAQKLHQIVEKGSYRDFSLALSQLVFARYNGGRPKEEAEQILGEAIKENRKTAKEILTALQKDYGRNDADAMAAISEMKGPVAALIEITRAFQQAYFDKKKNRSLLDFSDTERLTLNILRENEILRREMRKKYRYVFMDEYQDTNGIQEAILQCIVRENNYFMVGDVKQSIYRFRLADPGIFIEKLHLFAKADATEKEKAQNRLITLGRNFRSSSSVIDSVNGVFEQVMTEKVGEVTYDSRARLYQGLPNTGSVMPTEIHLLSLKQNHLEVDEETGEDNFTTVEEEAFYLASKIQEMVGKPLYRTRSGQELPLRYSDIGILMRSVASKGSVYKRVFKDAGIPLFFDGGEIYYTTTEVTLVINLLKLIDNPEQDMPLMAYILSPVGGFTAEDCAKIREDSDCRYFHQAFWCYGNQNEPVDEVIVKKINALAEQLKQWRFELQFLDVEAFLWKIYRDTGYYTFVGGLPGGEQRQSNLRQLPAKASAYKKSTMKGLFHFIRFVEDLRQRKIDDVPPGVLDGQEDAVQLMTIHKSKGLEFPVVFIAGAAGQINTSVGGGKLLFDKNLGLCPECIRVDQNQRFSTLAHTLCKEKQRMENLSEEMRLLYVAMTRAEERLFFVGSLPEKTLLSRRKKWQTAPNDYACSHVRGTLDWVMMAVQNAGAVFKIIETEVGEHPLRPIVNPVDQNTVTAEMVEEAQKIRARLSWHYPYGEGIFLPEKVTVTGISKLRQKGPTIEELPVCSPLPAFMQQDPEIGKDQDSVHSWTGAELGTAIHAILNDLNFDTLRQAKHLRRCIFDHAEMMVKSEKLSADILNAIDLDGIVIFLESGLGKRLLAAKTVWREKPFNYSISAGRILDEWQGSDESIVIQGMIDCCFLEEDEWVLLDYKTDWYRNLEEIEAIREKYREQVELYAEALAVLTGKKVKEKLLVLLKGNDVVEM